ncbi:MAG TPA: heavy metal-binding domain-containing protein, partial [Burkholderiales bacterium]|nr:heavy metal-binding domain-containing protein [Burkholderiales bacterium]
MNRGQLKRIAIVIALALMGAGGYWLGRDGAEISSLLSREKSPAATMPASGGKTAGAERNALYWYDPMSPQQRFDKPGKSPFMDMQLVPKYADDDAGGGVKIDPVLAQNLGL